MADSKTKARLYIDGNYTVRILKYLAKVYNKTIDWKKLLDYIKDRLAKEENSKLCLLEAHYFIGTGERTTDPERDRIFNAMDHARIQKHATPLRKKASGGLKEDAVDTNLVFNATRDYYHNDEYDYLVLLAGDSDFVPLVNGLKDEGVKTYVLYTDFEDDELKTTRAAETLLEITSIRDDIQALIRERVDEKITSIFTDLEEKPAARTESAATKKALLQDSEKTIVIKKADAPEPVQKKAVFVLKKQVPETVPQKNIVVAKKAESPLAFTKEQLEAAIKEKQEQFYGGANEYVLLAQVGEKLCEKTGKRLHGKLVTIIRRQFPNDFDLNEEPNAPKIRLK